MPNRITAYSCAFKCGRSILSSYSGMVAHEARCFDNPAMRACQTCANFMPATRGTWGDPGEYWWCAAFQSSFEDMGGRKFNCAKWERVKLKEGK